MAAGEFIFELKRPIKIVVPNEPEPVEITEIVLQEPNKLNLDDWFVFQGMGFTLFKEAMEKERAKGNPDAVAPAKTDEAEPDYKDVAMMIRLLVFSSYKLMSPADFINAFVKVVYCKNISYITAMSVKVTKFQFENIHRDDLVRLACEYFAFFGMSGLTD